MLVHYPSRKPQPNQKYPEADFRGHELLTVTRPRRLSWQPNRRPEGGWVERPVWERVLANAADRLSVPIIGKSTVVEVCHWIQPHAKCFMAVSGVRSKWRPLQFPITARKGLLMLGKSTTHRTHVLEHSGCSAAMPQVLNVNRERTLYVVSDCSSSKSGERKGLFAFCRNVIF